MKIFRVSPKPLLVLMEYDNSIRKIDNVIFITKLKKLNKDKINISIAGVVIFMRRPSSKLNSPRKFSLLLEL